MYGPSDATQTELTLLEPRRSLQNVGNKDKDEDEDRNRNIGGDQFQAFGADGFTFLDFLDIINPLQHIPIVGSAYRELTGDEIDPASRVIGGTLFGGPIGTVASLVNVSLEQETGKDMGDHVIAFFGGDDSAPEGDPAGPMLAGGPASRGQLADASLIPDNLEVLEWAKGEAAFAGGANAPGNIDEQAWVDPDLAATNGSGVSDATAHALRVAQRSGDVAGNVEVLDWARKEAAAVRVAVEKAAAREIEEQGTADETQAGIIQAAENRTARSIARHDQLLGASAPGGGWFSETMLTAMATYEKSANLNNLSDPRVGLKTVNVSN
ncbi:MAG: hypothetical protein ACTSV1_06775 [Alphaproteobacteria bacterium]